MKTADSPGIKRYLSISLITHAIILLPIILMIILAPKPVKITKQVTIVSSSGYKREKPIVAPEEIKKAVSKSKPTPKPKSKPSSKPNPTPTASKPVVAENSGVETSDNPIIDPNEVVTISGNSRTTTRNRKIEKSEVVYSETSFAENEENEESGASSSASKDEETGKSTEEKLNEFLEGEEGELFGDSKVGKKKSENNGSKVKDKNGISWEEGESIRVLIHKSEVEYPSDLKEKGVGGSVMIRFTVGQDGGVYSPEVVKSSGYNAFDTSALSAIRNYKFKPSSSTGNAVGTVVITFSPK